MFNLQRIKSLSFTTAVVATTVGLSIFSSANPSQAGTLTIPLSVESFSLNGDAQLLESPTSKIPDIISLGNGGSATSPVSPFLDLSKIKPTTLHFNYTFSGSDKLNLIFQKFNPDKLTFTEITKLSLAKSTGEVADFTLSDFVTSPGFYTVTHQLTGNGSAQFKDFSLVIQNVPEPSVILGLFGLGMAAFTLKNKRKLNVLVKSAS